MSTAIVNTDNCYDSEAQAARFEKRLFVTGDEKIGDITYYVFDPTKHGYPADREYPLLFGLHGAFGSTVGAMAADWAGAAMFAGDEYQKKVGGMYIVCPLANERVDEAGKLQMSWMTPKGPKNLSGYSAKVLEEITDFMAEDLRMSELLGADTVYSDALFELLHLCKQEFKCINKVIVMGASAGGYGTWRLLIDRPEEFALAIPICAAYLPAESEIRKVEAAGTPVFICHARHDEVVRYDFTVRPNLELYAQIPTFITYFPEWAVNGVGEIISMEGDPGVQIGQHCFENCIQQNLIYNDGTPYTEKLPEGVTGLIRSIL